jgi:O-antigen ligase
VYLFAFSAVLLACLGVGKAQMRDRVWRGIVALFALSGITVFLSYSRSFWVAVAAAGAVTLVWVLWKERVSFKRLLAVAILFIGIGLVDYAAIIGIVNFPLPGHVGVSSQSLLSDRTSNIGSEPAAASRWQLVKPLATASLHHAITGSGFGKTITYTSSDPRVVAEHPDGQYTTYAFEWGYLDLWLKMGAIGVITYAWLCIAILRAGYVQWKAAIVERPFVSGLLASLICLFGVHVFTPYLNHPLGIGWLLVVSLFFVNTVYEHAE